MAGRRFKILSMDGGGIHGLLTAYLLLRLERRCPGFLDDIDYFAGTSAGGIMALALAAAIDRVDKVDECIAFWTKRAIAWNTRLGTIQGIAGIAPVYSDAPWKREIEKLFRGKNVHKVDPCLGEIQPWVVIPTFKLFDRHPLRRTWRPKMFHNFRTDVDVDDFRFESEYPPKVQKERASEDFLVGDAKARAVDVAMRTSAAPIAHRSYQGYADGGLYADNPSLCAVTMALHNLDSRPKPIEGERRQHLDDLLLFSIGTGLNRDYVDSPSGLLGWFHWMTDARRPMLLLSMAGACLDRAVDVQVQSLLGPQQYFRLNPELPHKLTRVETPAARHVAALIDAATNANLDESIEWLSQSGWVSGGHAAAHHLTTRTATAAAPAVEKMVPNELKD